MQPSNRRVMPHPALPSWEQLCSFTTDPDLLKNASERGSVSELKSRPPNWFFATVRYLVKLLSRDYTYQKFVDVSWGEIVDLIHDQLARNRRLRALPAAQQEELAVSLNPHLNRLHNQLPCTLHTTRRRVAEAKRLCALDAPVLVVGDDDLVGIELARSGFRDVTSLDIDARVCQMLEEEAAREKLALTVYTHDIRTTPPPALTRDYALVFLDPMYSIAGIRLFLASALSMSNWRPGTYFFLSLHAMSLLRRGLDELPEVFAELGLEVVSFNAGFNTYPIPTGLKTLIKLFNRCFMRTQVMATEAYMFPYFMSDAIVLVKK